MEQITIDELNADIKAIFDRINRDHEVFSVMRNKNQAVVILDGEDYRSLTETLYLLQSPANAERLRRGMEQHRQGKFREIDVRHPQRGTGSPKSVIISDF